MSWTRYLLHDYFTAREFNRLDDDRRRRAWADRRARVRTNDRIAELEGDLASLAQLSRALVEACLSKGVVTREELAALADKLDELDGVKDGRLDPKRAQA